MVKHLEQVYKDAFIKFLSFAGLGILLAVGLSMFERLSLNSDMQIRMRFMGLPNNISIQQIMRHL
jgi:hypothetical protein